MNYSRERVSVSDKVGGTSNIARQMLNKVPEVTIFFWIIKVLCTTVGETASDFLNVNLGFGLTGTSVVMGVLLAVVLFFQFRAKKYVPGLYWLTVVLISIFGTLVTDNMTDGMSIPLEVSTVVFSVALVLTFAIWFASEKTLSIHSIFTRRRELFYWLTILFTFALGTAAGDLMAESLGLGYLITGVTVCLVIASVSVAWRFGLDSVLAFWVAYIMTRPLGASLGDYLSQPQKYGGLGLGATATSVIFILGILLIVVFMSVTKRDVLAGNSATVTRSTPKAAPKAVFWQVAVVIGVLVLASGMGYSWRQTMLRNEEKTAMAQTSLQKGTSNSVPEDSSHAGTSESTVSKSPLGDLSSFRKIEQDTLDLVNAGKMSEAKARVDDLEYSWDNAEAHLKPMNPEKWTEVDDSIDNVLRQLRSVHQDVAACKSSLQSSMSAMN